jgi:hypothetical protein
MVRYSWVIFSSSKIALEQKLEEIQVKWPTGELPWPETLQVTYGNPITVQEVHDDLKRETALFVPSANSLLVPAIFHAPDFATMQ